MASSKGKSRRHAHLKKRPVNDGHKERIYRATCGVCGKLCYLSRDEAKKAAKAAHPGKVMHVYSCKAAHGVIWWHISSIPADKLRELKERERG